MAPCVKYADPLSYAVLDDNTYTNKTWAEVSCFAVTEIHVMEVEFLSNMRYNLLASKGEWENWLLKLASFHEYYERASTMLVSPIVVNSPTNQGVNSPFLPPARGAVPQNPEFTLASTQVVASRLSPTSGHNQNWTAYQANAVSPLATKPATSGLGSRKRSPDPGELAEHPAKRIAPPRLGQVAMPGMTARPNGPAESARLSVPQLSVVTTMPQSAAPILPSQQQQQQQQYSTPGGYMPAAPAQAPNFVSLPPLQLGVRAMSTVFQPTTPVGIPHPAVPGSTGTISTPSTYHGAGVPTHPGMTYGTPTKHQSPANLAPYAPSPMAEFPPGSAVLTPISNSPSFYLQQRASPYKPIRHVNTLLYPPPSASLDQYHLAVPVQPTQMHYQPLGRRNDVRTGVVPEFVLYNRGQHQPLPLQGFTPRPFPS